MTDSRKQPSRKALNDFKLNALLEITHAINSDFDVDGLLGLYRATLEGSLGIEKLILYCHQGKWQSMLHFGFNGAPPDIEDAGVFLFAFGNFDRVSWVKIIWHFTRLCPMFAT